jgi:hypothetical protein
VGLRKVFAIALLEWTLVNGCTATRPADPLATYREALAATDPSRTPGVAPGSAAESAAVDRFVDFYKVFSAEVIRAKVHNIYAENAYLRDPFHEVRGIDAIETYFGNSTGAAEECTFEIQDVDGLRGNYYVRWIMHLKTKRDPQSPIEAVGVTHLRFDESGKVVLHQDYWDGGIVYERVPVVGWLIGKIKERIAGS